MAHSLKIFDKTYAFCSQPHGKSQFGRFVKTPLVRINCRRFAHFRGKITLVRKTAQILSMITVCYNRRKAGVNRLENPFERKEKL